jgi:predicted RNA-binding Zn-ribbon protein involved in translation (DUF1610 family)
MSLRERAEEYRQAMELKHGWGVELECTACGHSGPPEYKGWTPRYPTSFGSTPTIFADLECPSCGRSLEAEAGEKLVEMFSDVDIPSANRRLLVALTLCMVGLAAAAAILLAVTGSLWGAAPLFLLIPMLALIPVFNRRIASLRQDCDCGNPDYVFMGMLGRTYCFRCASCGRLLRLRD